MTTIPYFYIIQHKVTKKMYAGAKWKVGSTPDLLFQPKGYFTSSPTILDIINKEGFDVFEILRIDTYCDNIHPFKYETLFLETHNCASSDDWYNLHNNNYIKPNDEMRLIIKERYGVENVSQIPSVKLKKIKTSLARFKVKYPNQLPSVQEKTKQTNIERYGEEYIMQVDRFKEKSVAVCLEKYGVTHYPKTSECQEKIKTTCLEKYGVEYYTQSRQMIDKTEATCLEKYGVSNYAKSDEFKRTQGELMRIKQSLEPLVTCPHCGKTSKMRNLKPYHFDNCKKKPIMIL